MTLARLKYNITYMQFTKPHSDDAPGQSLQRLGSRIRMARTRRKLRQEDLARQIGRARATVVAIEKGSPHTEIGAYVAALWALGLLQELGQRRRCSVGSHRVALKGASFHDHVVVGILWRIPGCRSG